MWGYGWGWPAMLWMGLGGIFWLVVLGLLAWALVRWLSGRTIVNNNRVPGQELSALELLRQRYARGEIDEATYAQMRERLQAPPAQPAPPAPREPLTAVGDYKGPGDLHS